MRLAKRCPRCGLIKSDSDFYAGKNPYCKPCSRDYRSGRKARACGEAPKALELSLIHI